VLRLISLFIGVSLILSGITGVQHLEVGRGFIYRMHTPLTRLIALLLGIIFLFWYVGIRKRTKWGLRLTIGLFYLTICQIAYQGYEECRYFVYTAPRDTFGAVWVLVSTVGAAVLLYFILQKLRRSWNSQTVVVFVLVTLFCVNAHAQEVINPVQDGTKAGRIYLKWVLDINHDGIEDILIGEKPTEEEIHDGEVAARFIPESFQHEYYGFDVYLGLKDGHYINAGSIGVDVSRCYVGYIKDLKRYGIVTIENSVVDDPDEPQARHGVLKEQVIAYTIHRNKVVETKLTRLLDPDMKNPIVEDYLAASKIANVQLREIAPVSPR